MKREPTSHVCMKWRADRQEKRDNAKRSLRSAALEFAEAVDGYVSQRTGKSPGPLELELYKAARRYARVCPAKEGP